MLLYSVLFKIETLKIGENPWKFLYYTLLLLSPFFGVSAYLSYKLIQEIDSKDKLDAKKVSRNSNRLKARKSKKE